MVERIYGQQAPLYARADFIPRPIQPGTKACKVQGWQQPGLELDGRSIDQQTDKFGAHGIGLLLGSPMPDNTVLGALDIDDDRYVRLARALLGDPPCGRIGARGIAYLVRVRGDAAFRKFSVKGSNGAPDMVVGELLVRKKLLVLPPTIHPTTKRPYEWVDTPLLETDPAALPIIEV